MKCKFGFTLIELLAVIVILAIIALISTPIVLNIIEKAKEGAARSSAFGVIDAARLAYTQNMFDGRAPTSGNASSLQLSGDSATGGTWSLNLSTGIIRLSNVTFANNDYVCSGTAATMVCTKT